MVDTDRSHHGLLRCPTGASLVPLSLTTYSQRDGLELPIRHQVPLRVFDPYLADGINDRRKARRSALAFSWRRLYSRAALSRKGLSNSCGSKYSRSPGCPWVDREYFGGFSFSGGGIAPSWMRPGSQLASKFPGLLFVCLILLHYRFKEERNRSSRNLGTTIPPTRKVKRRLSSLSPQTSPADGVSLFFRCLQVGVEFPIPGLHCA